MRIDPSITDWITAVSTTGALIAATVAGVAAWRAFGLEKRATGQRDEDRRAEQASRVAAWIGEAEQDARGPQSARMLLAPSTYTACFVLNTSPLPVYDVLLRYVILGADRTPKTVGSSPARVIPPGEDIRPVTSSVRDEWEAHQDTHPTLAVEVRFTDASGRRWWRAWNGELIDKGPYKPDNGTVDSAPAE